MFNNLPKKFIFLPKMFIKSWRKQTRAMLKYVKKKEKIYDLKIIIAKQGIPKLGSLPSQFFFFLVLLLL